MYDTQGNVGPTTTIREAVGVFHDPACLQEAIDELLSSGFDRAEVQPARRQSKRSKKSSTTATARWRSWRTTHGCRAPLTSRWNPSVMRRAA